MSQKEPFFSIITVSFNSKDTIAGTVQSALDQTFADFEVVVKDGLSSDGTVDCVPRDEKVKVYSTKDKGIYDAMNEAITLSTGRYLIFMNCGDLFAADDVLEAIHSEVVNNDFPDVVYGDYEVDSVKCVQASQLSRFYLYRTPLCHQTMIIAKSAFDKLGLYDCSYKILADYDFTLRCRAAGLRFVHIAPVVCKYLGGGVSESKKGTKIKLKERKIILKKYYSRFERAKYGVILFLTFRKLRMWLFSNSCPRFLRSAYRKIVNRVNQK